ncbi:MAG: protein jag [Clostridiales bacterium]|nr:protein jag [Clostridiales bacterium]
MEYQIFTGKTVDDAVTNALVKFETTSDNIEFEILEKGSNGFLGMGSKPAKIQARIKEKEISSKSIEDTTVEFLGKVFEAMNLTVKVNVVISAEEVNVDLIGDEMGILIGKRGQTLDSLQYLLSLVINKNTDNYLRVKLDTENYRERRKETLENLAKNIAFKVKRTKRPVALEPMNPYERRIIHSALQNDRYVTTKSEGEEPYRHVVVVLKKNY